MLPWTSYAYGGGGDMGDCVDKSGGLVVDISGRMGGGQVGLDVYTCLILIHYATSQIK